MYFERYEYGDYCWWCNSNKISREHKYKRSEIEREYGSGTYGNKLLFIKNEKEQYIKSPGSNLLQFKNNLCPTCNNERSQPFDFAYDKFQKHIKNNQSQLLGNKYIDFNTLFVSCPDNSFQNLIRYFVKNVSCMLSDSGIKVEKGIIEFLNGNDFLPFMIFQFGIALDAVEMQKRAPSLQEESHFSRGQVHCIFNKDNSKARKIVSYIQYRWFRISYLIDKSIPPINVSKLNRKFALQELRNANTYKDSLKNKKTI